VSTGSCIVVVVVLVVVVVVVVVDVVVLVVVEVVVVVTSRVKFAGASAVRPELSTHCTFHRYEPYGNV
jgi:hypothetical protein